MSVSVPSLPVESQSQQQHHHHVLLPQQLNDIRPYPKAPLSTNSAASSSKVSSVAGPAPPPQPPNSIVSTRNGSRTHSPPRFFHNGSARGPGNLPGRPHPANSFNRYQNSQSSHTLLADESHAAVIRATGLPQGVTQRLFRKKIGYAVAACFPDPPRFKANIRHYKGKPEYGIIIFPNVDCANRFMRNYNYHSTKSVEISKHKIQFKREDIRSQKITQQEAACLRWKPGMHYEVNSDYEDDEEDSPIDVFVHHVEMGAWDARGDFAPAWVSKECHDRYSTVNLDGDTAKIQIRIEDQLISVALHNIDRLIVPPQSKDFYLYTNILPTFLNDESHGFAALQTVPGLMDIRGLNRDTTTYVRVPALDEDHAKVAPFCYVIKVRCTSRAELDKFLVRWQRKLIEVVEYFPIGRSAETPFANHYLINMRKWYRTIPFELAFQAQLLVQGGFLMPRELVALQPWIEAIAKALPPVKAGRLLYLVARHADYREPATESHSSVEALATIIQQHVESALKGKIGSLELDEDSGFFDIHATVITPAGISLEGPHRDTGNRIVRQFPGKEGYFMRVRIQDESGDIIREAKGVNNDREIFRLRMKNYLLNGIEVGGRVFRFLAFSSSSLKEHSTWFVADFEYEGRQYSAQAIRDDIGNLKVIKTPAKYAARMGQAFTSTAFSLPVESRKVTRVPDVQRNTYTFSDGCGTISYETLKRLHEMATRGRRNRHKSALPTVFQVRVGGAKGVLSLDTDLREWAMALRPSMIKFQLQDNGRNSEIFIEVANSADAALTTNLNRPLVALLETLGVPPVNFVAIQSQAVKELSGGATNISSAIKMYRAAGFGSAPDCTDLLQTLQRTLNIRGITDVPFLKKCNLTCLTSSLRQIKYKARCKVDEAWTLMGIMDESGWLKPNEIFVQLRDNKSGQVTFLSGACVVGRSPYMAPGDVQFAQLVGAPPVGNPLRNVYNCVVFSQQGTRPLCNQLAGGDLDGDLYNVIKNPLLFPQKTVSPAPYHAVKPQELNRECTVEDIVDFFLTYCQTDRLGMISDRHLLISDRSPEGVMHPDCVALAQLASVAVDYPKTGIAPSLSSMPHIQDNARPDYFQSEHRVESEGRKINRRAQWSREARIYYESKKALGQMFRKIDVNADISQWGRSAPEPLEEKTIRERYWAKIRPWLKDGWLLDPQPDMVRVQSFYARLEGLAQDFAPERRRDALSEPEIFMGCILGRFASRFGSGNRGYNAQVALRDDFSELIDQAMTEQCHSDEWNTQIISAATLATTEQSGQDIQTLRSEVENILTSLARWIRAAEMFEDTEYRGMSDSAEGGPTMTKPGDHFETAKWIAIGPALKKTEELEVFISYWTAQIEARLSALKASEDTAIYGDKLGVSTTATLTSAVVGKPGMTYITNAPKKA
ncbi:unnamed protein product [Sympodiomycopsis kandeliae]